MSLIDDNVIPGNDGRVFGTNAVSEKDLLAIKTAIQELDGIKAVELNHAIFPREFTVYTINLISITDIQKKVRQVGFHAIPKEEIDV